jgi:hypothetical protein
MRQCASFAVDSFPQTKFEFQTLGLCLCLHWARATTLQIRGRAFSSLVVSPEKSMTGTNRKKSSDLRLAVNQHQTKRESVDPRRLLKCREINGHEITGLRLSGSIPDLPRCLLRSGWPNKSEEFFPEESLGFFKEIEARDCLPSQGGGVCL